MKIKDRMDLIAWQGKSVSFEFFPPKTIEGEDQLFRTIKALESFNPTFVSVTYGAGGGTQKNTGHVVKRIKEETSLTTMPHLTCINQSNEELRGIIDKYQILGVENILALRGDPPQDSAGIRPNDGLCYGKDLVKLVDSYHHFSIGVAVYPEGHLESPSIDMDMTYTKQKIDAGADFAITQMFFINDFFYQFMDRAEKIGIDIPVIPGIMPVTDIEKIKKFSQRCGATLPARLVRQMEEAASFDDARKIGMEFATRQCDDLWKQGFHTFHFYTLNRADAVGEILNNLAPEKSLVAAL